MDPRQLDVMYSKRIHHHSNRREEMKRKRWSSANRGCSVHAFSIDIPYLRIENLKLEWTTAYPELCP